MPIDWTQLSDTDPKYLPKNPNAPPPVSAPTTIMTKYGPMVIRGAGGLLAGEGGPTGAFISGASELGAQALEGRRNPASVAGAAAIGAVPFGSTANIARAALKGGALSGGATALNQQTEEGLHAPTREELQQIALATGIGGATAGGLHALAGGAGKKIPLKEEPKQLYAGNPQKQLPPAELKRLTDKNVWHFGPGDNPPPPEVKLAGSGQTPAARAAGPVKPKAKVTPKQEPTVPLTGAPIVKTPKQLEDEALLKATLVRIQRENKTTPSTKNTKIPKVTPPEVPVPNPGESLEAFQKRTGRPLAEAKKIHERYNAAAEVDPTISKLVGGKGKPLKKNAPRKRAGKPIISADDPRLASNEGLAQESTVPIGEPSTANDYQGPPPQAPPVVEPPTNGPVNVNSGSMPNVAPPTANEPPVININPSTARSYQPPRLPKPADVGMRVQDLGGTRQGGGFIPPPSQPPPPDAGGFFNWAKRQIPRDPKTGRVDFSEIVNVPKAFKASADLSAPLRQGIFLMRRKAWRDSLVPMIRSIKNSNYEEELTKMRNHPRYKNAQADGVRFSVAGEGGKAGEEAFGSKLARKVPILGKYVVAPSERAYTTFLDSLRLKTYDEMMTQAEKMQARDPKAFGEIPRKNIANYINTASGRGSLAPTISSPSKTGERAAEVLNLGLFSPRFIASRMQLMNPYTYYKLDPFTRKEALKDMRSMVGMVGGALTLAKASGAEVTLDPRESDWGKIKSGNTRVDLTGGFGPYMRFFAQAMNGIGTGQDGPDLARFVKSKESPTVGIASEAISGKDFFGKEQARWKPVAKTVVPMIMEDWHDLLQSDPDILTGGGAGAAAMFGLPVQTYDSSGRRSGSKGSGSSARSTRTRYKP